MFTNGRSTGASQAQITTSDQRRAALWERIFGTNVLPVVHGQPRWQVQQGRGFEVLGYDLDTTRLSQWQRARFASHLSRVEKRPYADTIAEINSGKPYMIKASHDIQVLEPAEQMPLASLLPGFEQAAARLLRKRRDLWRRLAGV